MAVLSDKTIKEMIEEKQLVPEGNGNSAEFCSYEFTAASILRGGSHEVEQLVDSEVVIEPAQLVWIKAKEEISIPANMVGFWIQTQTLARDGLLLLNITLIEPGYEGPLSAVLVNFGKKRVPISSHTKIAKVIFLSLDKEATKRVGKWDSGDYDDMLMDIAANAPETFLQLQSFEQKAEEILKRMEEKVKERASGVVKDVKGTLEKDLKGDIRTYALKWGGGAAVGFALAFAAIVWVIFTLLPRLSAEYAGVKNMAQEAAITQQAETITELRTQLRAQTVEMESVKKQLNELKTNRNNLQSQGGISDKNPLPDGNNAVPKQ